jgi:HK97 family phage prohead protease
MTTIEQAERRIFEGVQIRDLETNSSYTELSGIAVPYDVETDIGWFVESFSRGSLDKSIRESAAALPLLMFHEDRALPIGSAKTWDTASGEGLRGVWRLDDGPIAQRAAKLVDDEFLNFMSIRFIPVRSEWTYVEDFNPDLGPAHKDRVIRTEARLLETSLVSTPAYNGAAIEWVRSGERAITREATGREVDAWAAWARDARGVTS